MKHKNKIFVFIIVFILILFLEPSGKIDFMLYGATIIDKEKTSSEKTKYMLFRGKLLYQIEEIDSIKTYNVGDYIIYKPNKTRTKK